MHDWIDFVDDFERITNSQNVNKVIHIFHLNNNEIFGPFALRFCCVLSYLRSISFVPLSISEKCIKLYVLWIVVSDRRKVQQR